MSGLFAPLHAQPAGAVGEDFIYIVEAGDTLLDLSSRYANSPSAWRELQQINQVTDERTLPIGKELKIPFSIIPVVATEAILSSSKGEVWVNDEPAQTAQALKAGDTLRTGNNGFATLTLEDKSTLTLPTNSTVRIQQLNAFERERLSDAIIDLQQGSVEGRIAPDNTGVGRFEINTPLSITGVRGTDLRVHAQGDQANTELLTGKAHLNSAQANHQSLQSQQGVVVKSDGSYSISTLLEAPALSEPVRGSKGWETQFSPIPNADHYVVQIALEADGTSVVKKYTVPTTTTDVVVASLSATGPEPHYAFIRAVDAQGLMGLNASVEFPGQQMLTVSDGSPLLTTYSGPVLLASY